MYYISMTFFASVPHMFYENNHSTAIILVTMG